MWEKDSTFAFCALLLIALSYCQEIVDGDKLKLCIIETQKNNRTIQKSCKKLNAPDSPITCVRGNDRFNCLRKVAEENGDFMVLEAEDLVAAASWSEFKVLVTSELRFFLNEDYEYQVVALMRNSAGIRSLSDVRGKRFCHPGYEFTSDWTPALATYFENTLIEKECDPNKTLIENRVAAASKYFESACMPGPWTPDAELDNTLKLRYKNLCAGCNNPAGCSSQDIFYGQEGVLICLTDYSGDIGWVRLAHAESHFQNLNLNKADYSFLCPDGTVRSMMTEEPCIWITRPWPVVVANSKKNSLVAKLMANAGNQSLSWQGAFVSLLENYHLSSMAPENLGTPDDYLKRAPGFLSANIRPNCRPSRNIQWCVLSNIEERKCLWLSQALSVYGTEPMVSCVTRSSKIECMEAVRKREADLLVITPQEELPARQKGLKRVVHMFTNNKQDYNKVAAVVRSNSKIRNLQQLKGSKACFTGYRSIGWNAFISIMRNNSGSSWDPCDAKAVSSYFTESCVPGLGKENDTIPSNLYSLCNGDKRNDDEASAFKCLANGGGDVAFISLETIKKNTGFQSKQTWGQGLKESDFRPLCFDDSKPETCYLTWTTFGSVMVYENISAIRFEEIYSTLLQLDQLFGPKYKEITPAFSIYGTYDGNRNIIFPEKTQRLQGDISHERMERNYESIVEDIIRNPPHNEARQLHLNHFQLLLCIAIGLLSRSTCSDI